MDFVCDECNKHFSRKDNLTRHEKSAHGKNNAKSNKSKYECYMCDKTFNRKNILNKHLKSEHDVVMHDYEYSDDDDDATPPPMERASIDLKDLTDIRAHEEIATPNYSKWKEHPYHVFKGVHSSSKSKP